MKSSPAESNLRLVVKIRTSTLYQSYEKAFEAVTGLPLLLQPAYASAEFVHQDGSPQNRFCQLLNEGRNCPGCSHTHAGLMREARDCADSCQCFAGLKESAVPIRFGEDTVAYLRTGQILHQRPKSGDFQALTADLIHEGYDDDEIKALRAAYLDTKVVSKSNYKQIITLLAIFSLQVSNLINQLVLAKSENEPPVISKAKQFIRERLNDRLSLEDVATAVGVSSFYFCKLFKQSTGMTFTEFVNRKRVESAKRSLLEPYARVTSVAFDVGYQSLSQFNRSFLKYAGESPTQFRKRMLTATKDEALVC